MALLGKLVSKRLVDLVKERPVLWDSQLSRKATSEQLKEAWEEIGKILNGSAMGCLKRWKNIMHRYRKEISRNTDNYNLMEQLSFLRSHVRLRNLKKRRVPIISEKYVTDNDSNDEDCSLESKEPNGVETTGVDIKIELDDESTLDSPKRRKLDDEDDHTISEETNSLDISDVDIKIEDDESKSASPATNPLDNIKIQNVISTAKPQETTTNLKLIPLKMLKVQIECMPKSVVAEASKRLESNGAVASTIKPQVTDSTSTKTEKHPNKKPQTAKILKVVEVNQTKAVPPLIAMTPLNAPPPLNALSPLNPVPPLKVVPAPGSVPPRKVVPPPGSVPPRKVVPPPGSVPPLKAVPPPGSVPPVNAVPAPGSVPPLKVVPPPGSVAPVKAVPVPASVSPLKVVPPPGSVPPRKVVPPPGSVPPPKPVLPPNAVPPIKPVPPPNAAPPANPVLPLKSTPPTREASAASTVQLKRLEVYGDNSFLISLLPYLNNMNREQNLSFKQNVFKLIDNILKENEHFSDSDD